MASSDYDSTYDSTYETNHSDSSDFAQNDEEGGKKSAEGRDYLAGGIVLHPLLPSSEVGRDPLRSSFLLPPFLCSCLTFVSLHLIHRWQDTPTPTPEPVEIPDLEPLMDQLNSWNFPIFSLVEKTHGETGSILSQVGQRRRECPASSSFDLYILSGLLKREVLLVFQVSYRLFEDTGLFEAFRIPLPEFMNYFRALENGYRVIPCKCELFLLFVYYNSYAWPFCISVIGHKIEANFSHEIGQGRTGVPATSGHHSCFCHRRLAETSSFPHN